MSEQPRTFTIGIIFPPNEQPYVLCGCSFKEGVANASEADNVISNHVHLRVVEPKPTRREKEFHDSEFDKCFGTTPRSDEV